MRKAYPVIMKLTRFFGVNNKAFSNKRSVKPAVPFYTLQANANTGKPISFADFQHKKVLLVNTASDCGYTGQYAELQQLHEQFPDLAILAFPANDFKEQEKADDQSIAAFCQVNYGVSFPLMQKTSVVKGTQQNPVFSWLSDAAKNGWNDQQPQWNFSKYLVNGKGELMNYFGPAISPVSDTFITALKQL
ncbi:glutathione peroxidase [Deminuibacter soli]|nr:glutathione peroxidase [Deminuibacter soli]